MWLPPSNYHTIQPRTHKVPMQIIALTLSHYHISKMSRCHDIALSRHRITHTAPMQILGPSRFQRAKVFREPMHYSYGYCVQQRSPDRSILVFLRLPKTLQRCFRSISSLIVIYTKGGKSWHREMNYCTSDHHMLYRQEQN